MFFNGYSSDNTLPFTSDTPLNGEREFRTEADIWNEVNEFCDFLPEHWKETGTESTIGKELYHWFEIKMTCGKWLVEDWMFDLVNEYNTALALDIPIASDLQNCRIRIVDYVPHIKDEMKAMADGNKGNSI